MAQAMSLPSALDMHLYLHALLFLVEYRQTKVMSTVRNYKSGMQLGYAVQVLLKALNAFTPAAGLGSVQNTLQTYMLYSNPTVMFEVNCSRNEGYALQSLRTRYGVSDWAVLPVKSGDEAVAQEALDCCHTID